MAVTVSAVTDRSVDLLSKTFFLVFQFAYLYSKYFSVAEDICKAKQCLWSALRSPAVQNYSTPLEWAGGAAQTQGRADLGCWT